ncbi:hypothetical protein K435DRAFT_889411, partial [Dendrothele bispora CBS 962.96]
TSSLLFLSFIYWAISSVVKSAIPCPILLSIERLWSGLGSVSNSIKEMGPGSHHDILEDHISYWNWNKVTGMGAILKRRLIAAVEEYQKQFESWMEFTQSQKQHTPIWKTMVDEYESGESDYNPYASPEMRAEERQMRDVDDDDDDDDHDLPDLETSPGEFLYYALEIEQQQRELREDIVTVRTPTNKQLTGMLDRRTKLTRQIRRFRALQLAYMPVSLHIIATLPPSQTQVNAEDLPLYLPSMLDSEQRSSDLCRACLPEMEIRLRDGQLNESLNHLRQALLVKQRMLRYKKTNARNQGATTRSRALISRQEKKVKLAAKTYQEAWKAKLALVGGDKDRVGWKELLQEHIICMEDLQDAEKKRAKAMKHKRREAARRALDGENPVQGAREKHRVPSWISHFSTEGELSQDTVLYDGEHFVSLVKC